MSNTRATRAAPSPPSAAAANDKKGPTPNDILQTARLSLELPKADEVWSAWYRESEDKFADFQSFGDTEGGANAAAPGTANASGSVAPRSSSHRTLSARRISGQFEEEVVKSWEEDWEDEDVEDTFDAIMGQVGRYEASRAASAIK
ncbi:hypothetical protein DQ04_00341030 [Trypanosoma grayi]|uniref:hypothetical protein n=1 Tax=Trypanosoma grayi TaxID=71804 RepID=UPI0004F3F428|nr:hypothetical protein DQ04_00341030 [Trypanosoma grayi]KEG14688.1 hypothetical protein DQ04_00341030 [Trypanosoma grayi]